MSLKKIFLNYLLPDNLGCEGPGWREAAVLPGGGRDRRQRHDRRLPHHQADRRRGQVRWVGYAKFEPILQFSDPKHYISGRVGVGSGSVIHRNGSDDPDPYQN